MLIHILRFFHELAPSCLGALYALMLVFTVSHFVRPPDAAAGIYMAN